MSEELEIKIKETVKLSQELNDKIEENVKISQEWKGKIEKSVKQYPIMVYMRGTPKAPRCGFSFRVMTVLDKLGKKYGVDFSTEDMDSDEELWSTLRELNDWRTSPQIYVNGEFIGGCDIFVELFKKGELQKMLN